MAEDICQEVHLLELAACLYSRSLTALPAYSLLLESINRDLRKQKKQLLLEQAGHLAAGFADCLYTFFSQLLLGKPAQIMSYRRLNIPSVGWQECVCTATRTCAPPLQLNNLLTKRARGAQGARAAHASIMETNVCKASVFSSNRHARQVSVGQILPIFLAFSFVGLFCLGFLTPLQYKTSMNHYSHWKECCQAQRTLAEGKKFF